MAHFAPDYSHINKILSSETKSIKDIDKLQDVYSAAILRNKQFTRLTYALYKKEIIGMGKSPTAINLWINSMEIDSFLNKETFSVEYSNAYNLKKLYPRLRTITTETLIQHLFIENGVRTWHI
ncbi:MAG: hypothetical protein ABFC94_09760 [Syntrophomonas sp.]